MNYLTKVVTSKIVIITVIAYMTASCSKFNNDEFGNRSPTLVEINMEGGSFDTAEDIENLTNTPNEAGQAARKKIQRNTIDLGDGLLMVATLMPEESQSIFAESRADTETTNLAPNVRYRLLVYTNAGAYVTERDYIRGQEGNTAPLLLDGDATYRFVAYSINSAAANLPAVIPAATANRTLANSQINVAGNQDYMYFQETMTVTGNNINRLNIILRHRFSQITATIDATQVGYNITAVTANFQPHNTNSLVNLSNGAFARNGTAGNSPVTFPTLGGQTVVASPTIINAPANRATIFQIPSITIGSIQRTNLTPFTTLEVTPGVKYNLRLNIVPDDQYLTHAGQLAARINGVIWARYNLGSVPVTAPDAVPMTVDRHGNYYQWGRNIASASSIAVTATFFFNNNEPPNNTWNSGTELNPIKTTLDPCPTGYRIPTSTEMSNLIVDTTPENMGPFQAGVARFDSAKILRSRRNAFVQLTFPAQGRMNVAGGNAPPYANTGILARGSEGYYHTSFSSPAIAISFLFFSANTALNTNIGTNRASKSLSNIIRCVAE